MNMYELVRYIVVIGNERRSLLLFCIWRIGVNQDFSYKKFNMGGIFEQYIVFVYVV